mmetsp:Transcript_46702/g.52975  ORF Transcript_46702/g.52975 Transcript_46702/m.52975 type:complete len:83 (-) Transcript_46702:18-266(-)
MGGIVTADDGVLLVEEEESSVVADRDWEDVAAMVKAVLQEQVVMKTKVSTTMLLLMLEIMVDIFVLVTSVLLWNGNCDGKVL